MSESREDKHVLLWFDPTEPDHKGDPKRESKSSFSPEEPKSKILRGYCGGQLSPAFKLYWRRPGPISSPICTNGVRKGQAQYPVWGQANIRGQPTKEEIKLPSEERWSMLVRNWAVSEDDSHLGNFVRDIWWTYQSLRATPRTNLTTKWRGKYQIKNNSKK